MDLNPKNKIDAIKILRSLPIAISEVSEFNTVRQTVNVALGLREAKELVEAIMQINSEGTIGFLNEKIANLERELTEERNRYYAFRQAIAHNLDTL